MRGSAWRLRPKQNQAAPLPPTGWKSALLQKRMGNTLKEICSYLCGVGMSSTVVGDDTREIVGVATLEDAGPGQISFLSNPKYEAMLATTKADCVVVANEQSVPDGMTVIRTKDSYAAIMAIMVRVHGYRKHKPIGISSAAVIDPSAKIGENATIHHGVTIDEGVTIGRNAVLYPGVYLARNCRIGDDCILYPNVVVYDDCIVGNRVTLHAGTVIGEDGLGYAPVGDKWYKIPQIGIAEVEDDVELGANCAVDRATLGKTVIGAGTKFSNLVAIGHGARIGQDCMFVAQVGIAGSVTVGRRVKIAGKAGVAGHLSIGDNAEIAAMAGVMRDVPANTRVGGAPAMPIKDFMRSASMLERLPQLYKQLQQLQERVEQLQKQLDGRP